MSTSRECTAKNPALCRYHGVKATVKRIQSNIRASEREYVTLEYKLTTLPKNDLTAQSELNTRLVKLYEKIYALHGDLRDAYPSSKDYFEERQLRSLYWETLNIDPNGDKDLQFGVKYVYCGSHRRAHTTGWCTVRNFNKVPLASQNEEYAVKEARKAGFDLYDDENEKRRIADMTNEEKTSYASRQKQEHVLEWLSKEEDENIRLAVAKNSSTPADTITRLSDSDQPKAIRLAATIHNRIPYDVLMKLQEDADDDVRILAAGGDFKK